MGEQGWSPCLNYPIWIVLMRQEKTIKFFL